MNTTEIGDLAELKFLLAFKERGVSVSLPFGNNQPYDMIVDINGELFKFQIKNSVVRDNVVRVKLRSDTYDTQGRGRKSESYRGKCDFIGAYCPEHNGFYVLDIEEFGVSVAYLRLKGGNYKSRYASEYELDKWLNNKDT
jgi:hypothetical protein